MVTDLLNPKAKLMIKHRRHTLLKLKMVAQLLPIKQLISLISKYLMTSLILYSLQVDTY